MNDSNNTWIHRIARVTLVKPLAATSVTPNQITTARLVTGLASAAAIGTGLSLWQNIGAAAFIISMLLDRVDGGLARLTGKTSAYGARYDLIADAVTNSLMLIGLAFGLRDSAFGFWAVPLGFVAAAAVAAVLALMVWAENTHGPGAAEFPSFAGFDPDDVLVLIPIAIWVDQMGILLVMAAICAPLFAIFFHLWLRRRLRAVKA
ncbi:MAG: CDP-alcohol phosphatidyltransferase family protein [Rhodospirillales bacterium]|nr:CDP-alcohol phosphatidyltransferase family protein [Rhodospirillales bacterium]MBI3113387.1 CDP-alcohol phosphatidyltransferase family protein [Rhodospirillales bacterium]